MEKLAVLRYSRALFSLAVEKNNVAEFHQAAESILAALNSDPDVYGVISHPGITYERKMEMLSAVFEGKVPDEFLGIFALMLRRGRKDTIWSVLTHFEVLYKEYCRITTAKISSSEELPPQRLNEIKEMLSKKLDKTVEVINIIDKSLIAGFKVEVDGFLFDGTTKHQLDNMKKQLLSSSH